MHQSKITRLDKLESVSNPEKHSITITRRIIERNEETGKLEIVHGYRLAPGKEPEFLDKEHFEGQDIGFVDHIARDKNYAPAPSNHVPVGPGRPPQSDKELLSQLLKNNPTLIESLKSLVKNDGGRNGKKHN